MQRFYSCILFCTSLALLSPLVDCSLRMSICEIGVEKWVFDKCVVHRCEVDFINFADHSIIEQSKSVCRCKISMGDSRVR